MEPTSRTIYEFREFRLDPQRHVLSKGGKPVSLAPKAFEILVLLLEHRDTMVSKADLLTQIWPNSFVEENNLAQHVSLLRKTLGENREKPLFIETVPRLGYRFIAEVRVVQNGHQNGTLSATDSVSSKVSSSNGAVRRKWPVAILALAALALLALSGVLFWPTPAPAVLDYVQLTHDGYPKKGPLMTDGEFLYCLEDRAGSRALVRVPMSGGEPVLLPPPPASMLPLDISATRREMLALEAGATGTEHPLWAWGLPGGGLRRVGSIQAHTAAWSAGTDRILYFHDGKLRAANSDGSGSEELATPQGSVSWLRISLDGSRMAFALRTTGSMEELWEARLDGTHARRISNVLLSDLWPEDGTWLPGSRYFLFSYMGKTRFSLWGLRRGFLEVIPENLMRLNTGLLNVTRMASTGEAHKIVAVGALDRVEVLRYNRTSGNLDPYLAGVSADGLAFSRPAGWLAYTTYPDRTLMRSRLDGSDKRQLTRGENALAPAWSPDGTRIAYMGLSGSEPWKINLISRDGGAPEKLLLGKEDEGNPTWSPDGKSLIYAGVPWLKGFAPESTAIHLVNLSNRSVTTLPESTGLWSPRWSPDGKYLIAETVDSQRLVLFDFSKQTWRSLASVQGASIGYTSWSHDSRYVYYNSYVYQQGWIYRADIARGVSELVWASTEPGMAITLGQWFTLAPDDSPLLLKDTSIQELFALDLRLP